MSELIIRDDVLALHTSDRLAYKRCRRKWKWSSRLYDHLRPNTESPAPLWFGSAFHFVMQDLHGYNRFKDDPIEALHAYARAFPEHKRPETWKELVELGEGMLAHYTSWIQRRDTYSTVWIKQVPQVEVQFNIVIPELTKYVSDNWEVLAPRFSANAEDEPPQVIYRGTFDRIVSDENDKWWVLDYKTAAQVDTAKLETDPQITSYVWAAEQVYNKPIEGVIYMQHRKDYPELPKQLAKGGISADKRQKSNHSLYRQSLISEYGSVADAPIKNRELLDMFLELEQPDSDKYIRRDVVRRNNSFVEAEHRKIVMEGYEMLNPDLYMYPNPTRDCAWDCQYKMACIAMDDGSDYEYILEEDFTMKEEEDVEWQNRIKYPEQEAQ